MLSLLLWAAVLGAASPQFSIGDSAVVKCETETEREKIFNCSIM